MPGTAERVDGFVRNSKTWKFHGGKEILFSVVFDFDFAKNKNMGIFGEALKRPYRQDQKRELRRGTRDIER